MNLRDIVIFIIILAMLVVVVISQELAKLRPQLNSKYRFEWKKWNISKYKTLFSYIKMGKEMLTLGDIEMENNIFYTYKSPIFSGCRYWWNINV